MSTAVGQITETRRGLGGELRRQIVLNNDQILALPSTVPLLVPAIPGKVIVPAKIVYKADPWFAKYTNLGLIGADWPSADLFSSGVHSAMSDTPLNLPFGTIGLGDYDSMLDVTVLSGSFASIADSAGMSLGLVSTSDNGDLGGGDPGNVLTVTVFYNLF